MNEQILKHLADIEEKYAVKVLFAVESGSRAWGFPSPDSDYDVRFIYIRRKETYLSIDEYKDTIEYLQDEVMDINGWDIRKCLQLLKKSNATIFEWLQSPIVYYNNPTFVSEMWALSTIYFSSNHTFNHYRGIATGSYKSNILEGKIKLKKLFYIIRPLLATKWIIEQQTIPPMATGALLKTLENATLVSTINELIAIKSTAEESYLHEIDDTIITFIEQEFLAIKDYSFSEENRNIDSKRINEYYRHLIEQFG